MLIVEWRERDRGEPPALQPVDHGGVYGNSLLGTDIGTILRGRARQSRPVKEDEEQYDTIRSGVVYVLCVYVIVAAC